MSSFQWILAESEPLVIDWSRIKFYNTIMSISAGSALASIAYVMSSFANSKKLNPRGWSINFGLLGIITFLTGLHMTLTWPLAPMYAYDNISFGEPMTVLGAILLALSAYFWSQGERIETESNPVEKVAGDFFQLRYILMAVGGSLISIGLAGIVYGLFTAPSEEPIVGITTDWKMTWLTTYPFSFIYMVIGASAILVPVALKRLSEGGNFKNTDFYLIKVIKFSGIALIVIGVIVYFTHIGMVINTGKQDVYVQQSE